LRTSHSFASSVSETKIFRSSSRFRTLHLDIDNGFHLLAIERMEHDDLVDMQDVKLRAMFRRG
jgi:hypothetical protein